ncbi:MAG: DUF481 domain-containing protein [Pseudomonadales bacterium]
MKKQTIFLTGSVLLSTTLLTHAHEEPEVPVDNSWIGNIGIGVVATDGNTENRSANANIDVTRDFDRWRHNLHIDSLYTADEQRTTAEKYFASWQSDYKLSERDYVFAYASYDDDRFSAFEWQATAVVGYGRILLATEDKNLNVEIGPGYRASRTAEVFQLDDNDDKVRVPPAGNFNLLEDNESLNEAILRLAEHFDWQFSPSSRFVQELNVEVGEDNTVTRGLLALESQIAGSLVVRLYYAIKHNTEVTDDTENSDTETGVTIAYNF